VREAFAAIKANLDTIAQLDLSELEPGDLPSLASRSMLGVR
jgi:hypothetical protein